MVFYRGWESKREEFKGSSHWYKLRLFIKIVQRTMWGKKGYVCNWQFLTLHNKILLYRKEIVHF
jgi:hypothetical protein